MVRIFHFLILFGLVLFPACITEDNCPDIETSFGGSKKVTFRVTTTTRVTESSFDKGDAIGVFAVLRQKDEIGVLQDSDNYAHNLKWVYDGETFIPATENDEITHPENGVLDFYCYYPYRHGVRPLALAVAPGTDFITAINKDGKYGEIPLIFHHRMARLLVTLDNPQNKVVDNVAVDVPRNATYNFFSDEITVNRASTLRYNLTKKDEEFYTGFVLPDTIYRFQVTQRGNMYVRYMMENKWTHWANSGTDHCFILPIGHVVTADEHRYVYNMTVYGTYYYWYIPDGEEYYVRIYKIGDIMDKRLDIYVNGELMFPDIISGWFYTVKNVREDIHFSHVVTTRN